MKYIIIDSQRPRSFLHTSDSSSTGYAQIAKQSQLDQKYSSSARKTIFSILSREPKVPGERRPSGPAGSKGIQGESGGKCLSK